MTVVVQQLSPGEDREDHGETEKVMLQYSGALNNTPTQPEEMNALDLWQRISLLIKIRRYRRRPVVVQC